MVHELINVKPDRTRHADMSEANFYYIARANVIVIVGNVKSKQDKILQAANQVCLNIIY